MLVGTEAKVLNGLPGVLWSTEQEGVASGRSTESQLIQGQSLTSSSSNASAGSGSEAESGNTELWDGQKTVVIGDSSNDDDGLVVRLLGGVGSDSRDGDWRSVDAGHKKTTQNNLVELGVGSAW